MSNYDKQLAAYKAANQKRAYSTFKVTNVEMIVGKNMTIETQEPLPAAPMPTRPTSGYDVLDHMIKPVADVAKVALGVYGAIEIADTIADASEPVVVTNQEVVPIEVPGETIVVDVPGETQIVEVPEVVTVPGDATIV